MTDHRTICRDPGPPKAHHPRAARWLVGALGVVLLGCGTSSDPQGGAAGGMPSGATGGSATTGAGGSGSGLACPPGQQLCGTACVNTQTDARNCGTCGATCAVGQACQLGQCECQAGLVNCAGQCVNTLSDGNHCGACGNACIAGQVCSSGGCGTTCGVGETACGTSCVNVSSNVSHCGACNQACGVGQTCTSGVCTCLTAGEVLCGGGCVNTQTDPANCGACAVACSSVQSCIAGVCTAIPGGSGGSGGAGSGGTAAGGSPAGGTATGGTAAGGMTTGGAAGATGGTATGGTATGGDAATGGTATGGAATGGDAATGGTATGGDAATGGTATGGAATGGVGTGGTPVSCSTPLADRVRVTSVAVSPSISFGSGQMWGSTGLPVILATSPNGLGKVAWTDGANVHVTPLDASDQRAGDDVTVEGSEVRGLVAHDDGSAVLVRRDDQMVFVRLNATGAAQSTLSIVGGNSHTTDGDRWIDTWPHNGRLAWSGTQYAAYFGQTGNHGAAGDHQGDHYTLISPEGAEMSGGWDWGCSHSLDVRIVHNGSAWAPICTSDTYPGAGIWFNNREEISSEPSITNTGEGTKLGGLVPTTDGFWLNFASTSVVFVHISNTGAVSGRGTLPDSSATYAHMAAYGDGLLAGWGSDTELTIAALDTSGSIVEGPVAITAQAGGLDDFATYPNGDVGWAHSWSGLSNLEVVRVSRCQ